MPGTTCGTALCCRMSGGVPAAMGLTASSALRYRPPGAATHRSTGVRFSTHGGETPQERVIFTVTPCVHATGEGVASRTLDSL
jgi:hypothetical protein